MLFDSLTDSLDRWRTDEKVATKAEPQTANR